MDRELAEKMMQQKHERTAKEAAAKYDDTFYKHRGNCVLDNNEPGYSYGRTTPRVVMTKASGEKNVFDSVSSATRVTGIVRSVISDALKNSTASFCLKYNEDVTFEYEKLK